MSAPRPLARVMRADPCAQLRGGGGGACGPPRAPTFFLAAATRPPRPRPACREARRCTFPFHLATHASNAMHRALSLRVSTRGSELERACGCSACAAPLRHFMQGWASAHMKDD
eukprot:5422768-Prymnesium_polylepis.1